MLHCYLNNVGSEGCCLLAVLVLEADGAVAEDGDSGLLLASDSHGLALAAILDDSVGAGRSVVATQIAVGQLAAVSAGAAQFAAVIDAAVRAVAVAVAQPVAVVDAAVGAVAPSVGVAVVRVAAVAVVQAVAYCYTVIDK